tara:strand:+ start:387 stop:839 length:453 start_codon:yes stop_codon:yes gene_type:complete
MVAEILAGAALVKASITGIKSAIGAAKDIGAITKDIDNLFDATKQLKRDEKQAKATGASATQIVIDQELAKEAIKECQALVIGRFGFNVWQDIIKLQKEQALEAKQKAAAERRAREVKKQEMEQAATVGASVLIGILVVGMVAVVLWAMP